jgi:hypothetical protein
MKVNLTIGTLITILTITAGLGGFYYTTQDRLDDMEQDISNLSKQIKVIKRQLKQR